MDKARAFPAAVDHPIDCGHLQIEEGSRLRFPTKRVHYFRAALHFFHNRIEAGEMHGDERHLLEHGSHAALDDLPVIVRGCDLPVTRVTSFTDRIEAAHEFGGVYRIAQLLERMGQRRDARFLLLLAGRSPTAPTGVNHPSLVRSPPELGPRQAKT